MARTKPRADIEIRARRTFDGLVVHHSKTRSGLTCDWEDVRHFHTSFHVDDRAVNESEYTKLRIQQKGKKFETPMRAIGFHFGVEYEESESGVFAPVIRHGRSLDLSGEHTRIKGSAYDNRYVGLLIVGDFDAKPMRPEMWDTCLRLTRALMDAFDFGAGNVIGHGEAEGMSSVADPRSCPGALIDMAKFRKDL